LSLLAPNSALHHSPPTQSLDAFRFVGCRSFVVVPGLLAMNG